MRDLVGGLIACLLLCLAQGCGSEGASDAPAQEEADLGGAGTQDMDHSDDDAQEEEQGPVVRLATWNVRLFFDDVCDLGICSEDGRERQPTTEQFQARAEQIADAVARVDADVIVLQEVETQACLDAVRQYLGEGYQVFEVGETRRAGSIDTAVIARTEAPARIVTHRQDSFVREDGETSQFLREFMEIHVTLEGSEVIMFAAHYRSQVNDDPAQRYAEATRSREILDDVAQRHPDALIVLGGDLNDIPGSRTLEILEEGDGLIRVASELEEDWTINSGHLAAFDHLYLVPGRGDYLEGSVEIIRDLPSGGGSDHAPLVANFTPPQP
jgi:endonuclease/exonuclease/phosphatase (EEP) superfamily protein YafD